MSNSDSPRLRTAKSYLGIFRTLDTSILQTLLVDNFTQTLGPRSLSIAGTVDKPAFIAHVASLKETMAGFPIEIVDFVESEGSNAVWAHCTSKVEWKAGVVGEGEKEEDWEFRCEYVFMFWMDGSGEKIVRVVEMLDSLAAGRLPGLMERARENLGRC